MPLVCVCVPRRTGKTARGKHVSQARAVRSGGFSSMTSAREYGPAAQSAAAESRGIKPRVVPRFYLQRSGRLSSSSAPFLSCNGSWPHLVFLRRGARTSGARSLRKKLSVKSWRVTFYAPVFSSPPACHRLRPVHVKHAGRWRRICCLLPACRLAATVVAFLDDFAGGDR